MLVKLAIETRAVHDHIGMRLREASNAFWCGNQAEKSNARCAGALEGGDRRGSASPGGKHRVKEKEISLRGIARDLEVVVHGLEGVVIAI